jgi:hypothetical protein
MLSLTQHITNDALFELAFHRRSWYSIRDPSSTQGARWIIFGLVQPLPSSWTTKCDVESWAWERRSGLLSKLNRRFHCPNFSYLSIFLFPSFSSLIKVSVVIYGIRLPAFVSAVHPFVVPSQPRSYPFYYTYRSDHSFDEYQSVRISRRSTKRFSNLYARSLWLYCCIYRIQALMDRHANGSSRSNSVFGPMSGTEHGWKMTLSDQWWRTATQKNHCVS